MSPHISIKGETVFEILGFPITNSFIVTTLVVFIFSFIARYYYRELQKEERSLRFYALHSIFVGLYGMFESILREKVTVFYALLGSFFFFILMSNWSGLIPGVGSILIKPQVNSTEVIKEESVYTDELSKEKITESEQPVEIEENTADSHNEVITETTDSSEVIVLNEEADLEENVDEVSHESGKIPLLRGGTADLNTTVALALISVFMTQLYGFKFLGPKKHLQKYFDFRDPIMIMLGPLEIIQEFARIISFGFRLYGNIFAGEVLLTIVPFLLPVFFSFIVAPMFLMEIFVGLVQALVFVMLSAVFINMAVSHH